MRILIDADACPRVVKEIIYRAAEKAHVELIAIANVHIRTPQVPYFKSITVPKGIDEADDYIAGYAQPGDLVITADIPLADRVISKGAVALDPRGELYTANNIQERLAMRNLMSELRSMGDVGGGPPPLNARDRQNFANQLNTFLSQQS